MKKINLLFVGSFSADNFSSNQKSEIDSKISGTVLSLSNTYKYFINYFSKRNSYKLNKFDTSVFRIKKYDKNHFSKLNYLIRFVHNYLNLILSIFFSNRILINSSPHGLAYLSPLIFLSRVLCKRSVLRIFGGREPLNVNFYLKPFVFVSLICSSNVGIQSKNITRKYNEFFSSKKFFWLPTARPMPDYSYLKKRHNLSHKFKGNFFYLGHIRKDKGIDFLIEAFNDERLSDFKLNLYGPLWGQMGEKEIYKLNIKGKKNIFYHGSIEPESVYKIISEQDALIFPSISPAEGYPGAVIEALLVGTPVIASNWLHLKEFLNDSNSILFEPYNSNLIVTSVLEFANNKERRISLHRGALKSSKTMFSLQKQSQSLIDFLKI